VSGRLPFWLSIGVLSLLQAAVVAAPVHLPAAGALARMRGGTWALIPAGSVVAFVVGVGSAGNAGAQALTYLALVAVPVLAAVALVFAGRRARPGGVVLAMALFGAAWADPGGLFGEAAAVALTALSCVLLGLLLAYVTPPRALAAGILAMAIADSALVISDLLQHPNDLLNGAHPAASLPRLQAAAFGSAVMGYGDLFVAGAFGGLLALHASARERRLGALGVAVAALSFDLLFFFVDELPATVPVAVALLAGIATRRLTAGRIGAQRNWRGHAHARAG
jgi:hypothetical protein